ncbi:MAG TPA: haloacid dehalogenase type II [Pseudonocardiaceae bacterium]|jgi:2-haloacid dehalogenase|nr:haloacid dehalogenase type II [Pseudonocardiaceae bacterium]
MDAPEAVLFDVFGTLVDWYSTIRDDARRITERAGVAVDPGPFAVMWRERYQPALEGVRSGARAFANFDQLHRETLDDVLHELGVDLGEADREELVAGWHRLQPWPDVPRGLAALRERVCVAALSNGHTRLLVDLRRHADLAFDTVFSAELAGTYKPDPAVYLTAARLLELRPDQILMVACHGWDLDGARSAGLRTAHVARPDEWGPGVSPRSVPKADLAVGDLHELLARLAPEGASPAAVRDDQPTTRVQGP